MGISLMTAEEKEIVSSWIDNVMYGKAPFSFKYGGNSSNGFINNWQVEKSSMTGGNDTIVHKVIYTDPQTNLTCILELTEYQDNPVVEWLLRFRNNGSQNTKILDDILAADIALGSKGEKNPVLYYSKGSSAKIDDFCLQKREIVQGNDIILASRGSSDVLPFFNTTFGDGGVVSAVGWTGNWIASFNCNHEGVIEFRAGISKTHLLLYPGEEIRTPRILLLFWKGVDRFRAHNMLRRHIVSHHLPRPGGKEVEAPICNCTWGGMKTENHLKVIRFIKENKLDFDFYWIDAGWYGPDHETEEFQNFYTEDWAYHMGIWRVNRMAHPDGLKPVSDAAHDAGMQLLLWFAPFMGVEDSQLQQEHPEWIDEKFIDGENGIGLNPQKAVIRRIMFRDAAAGKWLAGLISGLMDENGADHYREDIGIPGGGEDEPDRQGIGESKSIENFYAYWDELLLKRPDMLIDNCGGGGLRIDLETIGRSLVLHRSDYNCDPGALPIGSQMMTYGLAHWVPLVGGATPAAPGNTYNFRSGLSGGMAFSLFHPCGYGNAPLQPAENYPIEWHREMLKQFRQTRRFYKGDFYPLTECTLSEEDWMAYQLDCPDDGEGMVLAFRRGNSPYAVAEFELHGIDPSAQYELENVDMKESSELSGEEMLRSLRVSIPRKAESCLLFYQKV